MAGTTPWQKSALRWAPASRPSAGRRRRREAGVPPPTSFTPPAIPRSPSGHRRPRRLPAPPVHRLPSRSDSPPEAPIQPPCVAPGPARRRPSRSAVGVPVVEAGQPELVGADRRRQVVDGGHVVGVVVVAVDGLVVVLRRTGVAQEACRRQVEGRNCIGPRAPELEGPSLRPKSDST